MIQSSLETYKKPIFFKIYIINISDPIIPDKYDKIEGASGNATIH